MFTLFAILLAFNLINHGSGSHLCTGVHGNINVTHQTSGALLVYNMDLTVQPNPSGFETMQITNTKLWAINSSFSANELSFYSEVQNREFRCNSDIGNCTLTFIDGGGLLKLYVDIEDVRSELLIIDDATYFKGTIFWNDGMAFTPDNACIMGYEWVSNLPGSTMYLEYCCNRFETLPPAPPVKNQCLQYTSNVEFYNDTMTLANLELTYDHFMNSNMTINAINFTSNVGYLKYVQSINYGAFKQCVGDTTQPQSNCYAHLYDPYTHKDSEFAFFVDIYDNAQTLHWHSVAGSFEFRNGTVMRNGSQPFTPDQPCQYYQQGPIGIADKYKDDGISSKSSYCCSKWQNPVPSTTPSTGSCSAYNLTLQVANSTNFGGPLLSTFVGTMTVTPGVFHIKPIQFSTFENSGNYDISFLYNEYDTRNCRGSTTNLKECSMKETDGTQYTFTYATSFAQDGFPFFTFSANNGLLTQPNLQNGCATMVSTYNYQYPKMYLNANLCCIN